MRSACVASHVSHPAVLQLPLRLFTPSAVNPAASCSRRLWRLENFLRARMHDCLSVVLVTHVVIQVSRLVSLKSSLFGALTLGLQLTGNIHKFLSR